MARASGSYDYEKYGQGFVLMPEGVHEFRIENGQEAYSKRGTAQWELELQPLDPQYQQEGGYKLWLSIDGCVEALFDAMGMDPRKADPNREYYPGEFVNVRLKAEVHHRTSKNKDGEERTFANIKRLYPAFNMQHSPQPSGQQYNGQNGQQGGAHGGLGQSQGGAVPAGGFGGGGDFGQGRPAEDEIPF